MEHPCQVLMCRVLNFPSPRETYVHLQVFANVRPDQKIWQEEIFGPVLSVTTFSTEKEAIALANNSKYGLAGALRCASLQEVL